MSKPDKQDEARLHAERASRQIKHAGQNVARAARSELEHADEVVEGTIASGIDTSKRRVRRIDSRGLAMLSKDTATGFLALSVSLYSATLAFNKFRDVYRMRGRAVSP